MLRNIVLLALPGVAPFELGVICEVFGVDRSDSGGPRFDFTIATADPGLVRTSLGCDMIIDAGLDTAAEARGAWVLSVGSGGFALAQAGILGGRRATAHWMHAAALADRFALVDVDADVLLVDDRRVVTSAGTAAEIDAALHIVRREFGAAAANVIVRRMVVPPQRDGGQLHYIESPVKAECADSFAANAGWMLENLSASLTVDQFARQALMSSRTFARRFRADMGTTLAAWLNRPRLIRAQQQLEQTDDSLELIAQATGFGTASVMRHHFVTVLQVSPLAYRRAFGLGLAS